MPALPLGLDVIVDDPSLRGAPTTVYLWLVPRLDREEWRPMKTWAIAHSLRLNRETVSMALRRLAARGLITRRARGRSIREFRLGPEAQCAWMPPKSAVVRR